jgi:hypothetical protein
MILRDQEEEVKIQAKPILMVVLCIVLAFTLFKLLKTESPPETIGEVQEKEILTESVEAFWRPIKDLINEVNLNAETHIAINKLEVGEQLSCEIFLKDSHQLLSKIDGPEEQIITWKGQTDDELAYQLIGRVYLSGWTPNEGESFAYATLEVLGPDNSVKMERIYPIDDSSQAKKERILKIEAGESLPPPEPSAPPLI